MTLQAYPVRLDQGVVRTVDGSSLPKNAYAVLVVMPEPAVAKSAEEWEAPFTQFLEMLSRDFSVGFDDVSDEELNTIIHAAR